MEMWQGRIKQVYFFQLIKKSSKWDLNFETCHASCQKMEHDSSSRFDANSVQSLHMMKQSRTGNFLSSQEETDQSHYQSGTKPNLVAKILATKFGSFFCGIYNALKKNFNII